MEFSSKVVVLWILGITMAIIGQVSSFYVEDEHLSNLLFAWGWMGAGIFIGSFWGAFIQTVFIERTRP